MTRHFRAGLLLGHPAFAGLFKIRIKNAYHVSSLYRGQIHSVFPISNIQYLISIFYRQLQRSLRDDIQYLVSSIQHPTYYSGFSACNFSANHSKTFSRTGSNLIFSTTSLAKAKISNFLAFDFSIPRARI